MILGAKERTSARPGAAGTRVQRAFWLLLYLVFPLIIMPKAILEWIPGVTFPAQGFAEVLIPKLIIFAALWVLGARVCWKLWCSGNLTLLESTSPLRHPFAWLWLFLTASLIVSLLNPAPLGLNLPLIDDRYESVLFRILEVAWYALAFLAAGLSQSRVLKLSWVLHLMALGAALTGGWALLEAYGVNPLNLIDPSATIGNNLNATMGHQSYVAAFVAVVLVFWVSWRLLLHRVRVLDGVVITFLTACLVATGGRAGLLAAVASLLILALIWFRQQQRPPSRYLLVLGVLMVIAAGTPLLTSPHAQLRLGKLGSAVEGQDPATSHRVIFWQVGIKAITKRPLTGYGIDAFGNAAWFFATPEQADEMLTEFLPRRIAERTLRLGNLALYRAANSGVLELQPVKPYRVHNYFLDLAFASGIPVLLLFMGFLLTTAWTLLRAGTPVALATLLALTTYLIYGMVWFATPNVDPLVWGLVGLGLGSVWGEPEAEPRDSV